MSDKESIYAALDEEFWQDIETLAYSLDGETAAEQHERIDRFLARFLEDEDVRSPMVNFRRYAVMHLLKSVWAARRALRGPRKIAGTCSVRRQLRARN